MTVTAGCGLIDESGSAPTPSPEPTVPFTKETVAAEIEAVARNGGLPASALVEVGGDHYLNDPRSLAAMAAACERGR